MIFSEQLWQSIEPIYQKILAHPFITELSAGTLDQNKFIFYLQQDALYLNDFGRALAIAGTKANDVSDFLTCLDFAKGALTAEISLHQHYFKIFNVNSMIKKSRSCAAYTDFLLTAAQQDFATGMAALLPCFWIYQEVGQHILKQAASNNPYQLWFEIYAGEEFAQGAEQAIALTNKAAMGTSEKLQQQMQQNFITAAEYEWEFWDSAY